MPPTLRLIDCAAPQKDRSFITDEQMAKWLRSQCGERKPQIEVSREMALEIAVRLEMSGR